MARQLYLAGSSIGKQQADRDTPLADADINERIPITSRNNVETAKTIEEVLDCIGEEVVYREVTRIIRRLPFEMEFNPTIAARMLAYSYGVAAAPVGATANKVFTVTVLATGGSYTLEIEYEGVTALSQPIPWNATQAAFKYALESLENIGFGNTTVALAGGVYTVTLLGKRAAAPVPLPVLDAAQATGGVVTVELITEGSQRSHLITETPGYSLPYTSFVLGFEDEPGSARKLVGAVLENVRLNLPEGNGKITLSGDIVARDLIPVPGFIVPACVVRRPYRTGECLLTHNGVDITSSLIDASYSYGNAVVTGNAAYTGRGITPSRLERSKRRTRALPFRLLGGLTSSIRSEAETNPEADVKRATSLRVGVEGDNITINVPSNLLEVDSGGGLDFQGETEDSINRYVSNPSKVGVTPPTNIVAYIAQATPFLTT